MLCSAYVRIYAVSGAGTNLKVGAPIRRKAPEKFFCRAPPLFGSKSTIGTFGERFRDGQYSLVSFLFAVLLFTVYAPVPHRVGASVRSTVGYRLCKHCRQ